MRAWGAGVSATGFTTWEDELGLDRWRTGDVFGEAELPVLFAHGQHNRPGGDSAFSGTPPRPIGPAP
jgi:hypothetical protein